MEFFCYDERAGKNTLALSYCRESAFWSCCLSVLLVGEGQVRAEALLAAAPRADASSFWAALCCSFRCLLADTSYYGAVSSPLK